MRISQESPQHPQTWKNPGHDRQLLRPKRILADRQGLQIDWQTREDEKEYANAPRVQIP